MKPRPNRSSRTTRHGRILTGSAALLAAVLMPSPNAAAVTHHWDSTAAPLSSTSANWIADASGTVIAGSAVPTPADLVVFNGSSINGAGTIQLAGSQSAPGLVFSNTGTTLMDPTSATAQVLTLGASSLTINAGAGAVTIGDAVNPASIFLSANQTWLNNSANALTIAGGVGNGISIGTNTLTISTAATGTGCVFVNADGTAGVTLTTPNHVCPTFNTGSGSGTTAIAAIAAIGASVTSITQHSATSQLTLSGNTNASHFRSAVTARIRP